MIVSWLSCKLNTDLAHTITQILAATTIQSYARRRLAAKEAHRRRNSGDYAFHEIMEGASIMCWMTHDAYMEHVRRRFANLPSCYHQQAARQSESPHSASSPQAAS